jgi:hypothetical protein
MIRQKNEGNGKGENGVQDRGVKRVRMLKE